MNKPDHAEQQVDMSPEAIDRRLREVEELRRLCLSLGGARRVDIEGIAEGPRRRGRDHDEHLYDEPQER